MFQKAYNLFEGFIEEGIVSTLKASHVQNPIFIKLWEDQVARFGKPCIKLKYCPYSWLRRNSPKVPITGDEGDEISNDWTDVIDEVCKSRELPFLEDIRNSLYESIGQSFSSTDLDIVPNSITSMKCDHAECLCPAPFLAGYSTLDYRGNISGTAYPVGGRALPLYEMYESLASIDQNEIKVQNHE